MKLPPIEYLPLILLAIAFGYLFGALRYILRFRPGDSRPRPGDNRPRPTTPKPFIFPKGQKRGSTFNPEDDWG
jgi:hypothetical protein